MKDTTGLWIAVFAITILYGTILCWHDFRIGNLEDSPHPPSITDEAQRGTDTPHYFITIGTSVDAYDQGKEITLIDLQYKIGVDADGVLGPKTVQRVLDLNRLEIK